MNIKMSFYDYLNKFLLGCVLVGFILFSYYDKIIEYNIDFINIKDNNVILSLIFISIFSIIYEIGLVINRLGSLLEEGLKKIRLIKFDNDYKKFNDKKKEYPILTTLSREFALSRNSIVLFAIITIVTFCRFCCWGGGIPLAITILFGFSCRKYSYKIYKLMN